MTETILGMAICMPNIGIAIAGLPNVVTLMSSFFFSSVRP